MAKTEIEIALARGRLQERIAGQRAMLAAQMPPIAGALATADRALASGRRSLAWVKAHPLQVGAAVALLAALRPRRVWRWGRRAFIVWSAWRKVRLHMAESSLLKRISSARR